MTRTINNYIEKEEIAKKAKVETTGDDMREGLTCVLSVKVPEPKFSSQTKDRLVSSEVQPVVQEIVGAEARRVPAWRSRRMPASSAPRSSKPRARARPRARRASSRAARACSTAWDCRASSPTARSATRRCASSTWWRAIRPAARPSRAATASSRRSCRSRARSSTSSARASTRSSPRTEVATLITALGAGIGEDFNLEKLRYHRVIIMTDADVDGAHIRTLLLTFFYRQMPVLLEQGPHLRGAAAALQGEERQGRALPQGRARAQAAPAAPRAQRRLARAGRGRRAARRRGARAHRLRVPHDRGGDRAPVGRHGFVGAARDARACRASRSPTRMARPRRRRRSTRRSRPTRPRRTSSAIPPPTAGACAWRRWSTATRSRP